MRQPLARVLEADAVSPFRVSVKARTAVADFEAQATQCWRNVKAVLAAAGMGVENLVKCTHFVTRAEDVAAYGKIRARELGEARPASTLLVISALARPGLLVEVEAIAAKA